jgi:hypothetical protein
MALFYPFPADSTCSRPDLLFMFNLTLGEEIIDYRVHNGGVLFRTHIDSVTIILITYRQHFKTDEVKYLLSPTKYRHKPLEFTA